MRVKPLWQDFVLDYIESANDKRKDATEFREKAWDAFHALASRADEIAREKGGESACCRDRIDGLVKAGGRPWTERRKRKWDFAKYKSPSDNCVRAREELKRLAKIIDESQADGDE